jgi:hypothetical protein
MAGHVDLILSDRMKEGQVQQIELAVEASAALKQYQEAKDQESRAKALTEIEKVIRKIRASEVKEKGDAKGAGK